jgi:phosphatidylserine/phosphatidylglycerophosphate/cardiolipin synthase-like enzyme
MHHKYAVFDGKTAVSGSYNWTRSASRHNHENLILTDDKRLITAFEGSFQQLWSELSSS